MKKILFLLILVFANTVSAQNLSEEYAAIMNDLMYMKYKQKFKHLDKVFKDNPNDPWYYWMKADIYALGEKDKETRACYEKAISLDSNFAAGYGSYARYLLHSDSTSYKQVIEMSTKAIQLDPLDYFYVADRANAYLLMKDYTYAIADAKFFTKHTDEFSFEGNLVLLHCYIEMNDQAKLKDLLMSVNTQGMGFIIGTKDALLMAKYYESYGEKERACNCYYNAADPYEMAGEQVPADLAEKLKKCEE